MPQLTDQQIAQHAATAGFTGQDLETAIAVALAESGGNSDAIGDVTLQSDVWGPSVGLWQIRSVNPGHGNAFDQAHRNHQANLDPATNAANAHAIFEQSGWRQWSTYTNGDYRQFLDRARNVTGDQRGEATPQNPVQNAANQGGSSNSQGFESVLAKLLEAFTKLANPADKMRAVQRQAGAAVVSDDAFSQMGVQAANAHRAVQGRHADASGRAGVRFDEQRTRLGEGRTAYEDQATQQAQRVDATVSDRILEA